MAFNLEPIGKIIGELMYGDKCTVSRKNATTDAFGATKTDGRAIVYTDIKCKFSFNSIDVPADGNEAYVPILKSIKVFTNLEYNIKAGDYISGYREDITNGIKQLIEGMCGEPNRFDTHQEIPIQIAEEN